jgi:hypothetical protein
MQKLKMGAMKGIENHNERAKESHTNPDIEKDRSHLNYDLHQADKRTYYMRVKDRIKELDLPKAVRKDAVVSVGFITTSDKAYFERLTDEQTKKYFETSYDFLKNRYGEENVISSKVHLDERTPHMHTYIVPVTEDGRLSAKSIFTKKELTSLQADYNNHMRGQGFDLEKGQSTRGHVETAEFKKQTAFKELQQVENKVSELKAHEQNLTSKINDLQKERESIRDELKSVEGVKADFDKINALEVKNGRFRDKDKVIVKADDFEELKDIGKRQHVIERKNEFLERENKSLRQDLNKVSDKTLDKNRQSMEQESKLRGMTKELDSVREYLTVNNKLDDYREFRDQQKKLAKQQIQTIER